MTQSSMRELRSALIEAIGIPPSQVSTVLRNAIDAVNAADHDFTEKEKRRIADARRSSDALVVTCVADISIMRKWAGNGKHTHSIMFGQGHTAAIALMKTHFPLVRVAMKLKLTLQHGGWLRSNL